MLRSYRLSSQILHYLATSLTKLSILALVYQIVAAGKSRTRYAVVALSFIITADAFTFVVVDIFQCG